MSNLPNFFIIGANKAGTTSLYHYLNQHPEIYMSPVKEPMFFSLEGVDIDEKAYDFKNAFNTLEEYKTLFKSIKKERAIGEASTAYLSNHNAANNIKKHVPDAKIIVVLRNPIDRAYSNYVMHLGRGMETESDFRKAIDNAKDKLGQDYLRKWRYTDIGFYHEHLSRYYDVFEQNQIKVYTYDDYNSKPKEIIKDIFEFLQVDNSFKPDISKRYNTASKHKKAFSNNSDLSSIKKSIKKALKIFKQPQSLFKNKKKIKPLDIETKRFLIDCYKEDILKTQELINKDLTHWLN